MDEEEVDHPWVFAAQHMNPEVLPTIVKWDPVTVRDTDTGEAKDYVLQTAANGAGVSTVFLSIEAFRQLLVTGVQFIQAYEARKEGTEKKIQVVSPQEFRRDLSLGRLPIDLRKENQ